MNMNEHRAGGMINDYIRYRNDRSCSALSASLSDCLTPILIGSHAYLPTLDILQPRSAAAAAAAPAALGASGAAAPGWPEVHQHVRWTVAGAGWRLPGLTG